MFFKNAEKIKKYDRIISLGDSCFCAVQLRHYNLRPDGVRHPFDWLKGSNLETRIKIITDDFHEFIRFDKMNFIAFDSSDDIDRSFNKYIDLTTNLVFVHDFPKNLSFISAIPNVISKYAPRIKLFKQDLIDKKKILFVYITDEKVESKKLKLLLSQLHNKFEYNDIDFLILQESDGIRNSYRKIKVSKNITKYKFGCKLISFNTDYLDESKRKMLDKIFKKIALN